MAGKINIFLMFFMGLVLLWLGLSVIVKLMVVDQADIVSDIILYWPGIIVSLGGGFMTSYASVLFLSRQCGDS